MYKSTGTIIIPVTSGVQDYMHEYTLPEADTNYCMHAYMYNASIDVVTDVCTCR